MTTALRRTAEPDAMPARRHRVLAAAAAVFVVSWVAGLMVAPAAPDPDAPAARIAAYFTAHQGATTLQELLVHGLAGLALVTSAATLRAGRSATVSGLAAAAVSLVQAGVGVALAQWIARHGSAGDAATAFDVVNLADSTKLVLLAAFAVLASRRMSTRARRASAGVAALLATSALAFLPGCAALYPLLYLSLPALLAWVGAVAVAATRHTRRRGPAMMAAGHGGADRGR